MVFDNVYTVRITSISLSGSCNERGYVLRVFTREKIKSIHAKAIRKAWSESICCRKRKLTIKSNEIRIQLKKGDTVQKYIDRISGIIGRLKYYINETGYMKLKMRMKHAKLKKDLPSRVYWPAGRESIQRHFEMMI